MKQMLLLLSTALFLQAQMPMGMPPGSDHREIENLRIYKMTEYLELTPEQSEILFPKLRAHWVEINDIRLSLHTLSAETRTEDGLISKDMTLAELDALLLRIRDLEDRERDARIAFTEDLKHVLEPWQLARFMYFEHSFRKELQQTMRDKWKKHKRR